MSTTAPQPRPGLRPPQPVAAGPVPLIRNRNFQALWTSQFAGTVGKEASDIAYPLLILATTGSAAKAGIVGSAQLLAIGLASIPGGALADRVNRRLLLISADLTRLAMLLVLGFLILTGHTDILLIFGIAVGSSACFGFATPPALAAIKPLVPPSQLAQATEQNQIRPFAATTIGSPIGGSLFGLGRSIPFFGTAAAVACSAGLLLLINKPLQVPATTGEPQRGMKEAFRFVFRTPILLLWMIWVVGSNMAFNHTGTFLAVVATAKSRGASPSLIGLTLAISGLGGVAGALVAGPVIKRLRPSTIFIIAAWLGPGAAVLLATVHGVLPLGFILAGVFVRAPVTNGLFFSYVATLVPDYLQGRVLGTVTFLSYLAQPIGILGIGIIFDRNGPTWVFIVMGVIAALAALPTLTRTIRKLPTPQEVAV